MRRGLVILSIFALAFAVSCGGDDGGSTTPNPDPGTNNPPPPARYIEDMRVMASPTVPSYQGFQPDLTGLIVDVKWNDTGWQVISDTTQFYTVPSVISEPSGSPTAVGAYKVFHNSTNNVAKDISLPLVVGIRALELTTVGTASGDVFEDEPINTAGMVLNAQYDAIGSAEIPFAHDAAVGGNAGTIPASTELPMKKIPISGEWANWTHDATTKTLTYAIGSFTAPFNYTNYYEVDKIEYKGITGSFAKFTADEATLKNPGSNTLYPNAADKIAVAEKWFDMLSTAGVEFNVFYYGYPNNPKVKTMYDYRRAFQQQDIDGNFTRKASYPILSEDDFATAVSAGNDINLFLQYYDKNINATYATPTLDKDKPCQMLITFPLTSIYQYDLTEARRKDNTGDYPAEVLAPNGTREELLLALDTYYEVRRLYVNADRSDTIPVVIPFASGSTDPGVPTTKGGDGWQGYAATTAGAEYPDFFGNQNPDTTMLEGNELEVRIPYPESMDNANYAVGSGPRQYEPVFFPFNIHPETP